MMNDRKLKVTRVVVKKNGISVYDQEFHSGINVIRGENSTGKSTVVELISYGLGADIKKQHWKEEALSCDEIYIAVDINSRSYVFKRPIEAETNKPPIFMREGSFEDHKSSEGWTKYGYQQTGNKKSFSARIFDLLGYESHITNQNDSLTIHQLFRLMYSDQDTPASNIFRWESLNYDRESMRTAIGEFLFGFDDLTVHELRQDLIRLERSFEKLDNDLKSVYQLLGRTNIKASTNELQNEISNLNTDLQVLSDKKKSLRSDNIKSHDPELEREAKKLDEQIISSSEKIVRLKDEIISISYDIEENKAFIDTLKLRKAAISNSQAAVNALGIVDFEYCPSCLSKVSSTDKGSACSLCKEKIDEEIVNKSYLEAIEKIDFQLKETDEILSVEKYDREKLVSELTSISQYLDRLKTQFQEINSYSSEYEIELMKISSEEGFISSQIQSLTDKLELAAELDSKVQEKVRLSSDIQLKKDEIQRLEASYYRRKSKVLGSISASVVNILSRDTGTEDSFKEAKKFEIDFAQNIMLLDGRANFSASSNVLLKNSFHLAVLIAACNDKGFRLPCFTMFDNIEDKGMTESRSKNFQRIMLSLCSNIKTDYQIIMTTSMVDESLNNDDFGVGPYYDKGEHTLNF